MLPWLRMMGSVWGCDVVKRKGFAEVEKALPSLAHLCHPFPDPLPPGTAKDEIPGSRLGTVWLLVAFLKQ